MTSNNSNTSNEERSWTDYFKGFFVSDPNSEIQKLEKEKNDIETDCQKKIEDIGIKIQEEQAKINTNTNISGGRRRYGGGKSRSKTRKGKKSANGGSTKNRTIHISK